MSKGTRTQKKGGAACLPCMAALGPPGIAVGAVGLAGYGAYKYSKKKKKKKGGGLTISRALQSPQKQKKKTKKKLKGRLQKIRNKSLSPIRYNSNADAHINNRFMIYQDLPGFKETFHTMGKVMEIPLRNSGYIYNGIDERNKHIKNSINLYDSMNFEID